MNRRQFLITSALALASPIRSHSQSNGITIFLCGDVMTGRGVDQILPHPSASELRERYVVDAKQYVTLAEQVSGPIAKPVDYAYIWGDALDGLRAADVRIVNLETAITTSDRFLPGKAIHYRMNPENIPCITRAEIDCCVLANNHVLDFGPEGLSQTLSSLEDAGIRVAGAGRDADAAAAPAVLDLPGRGRILVFAYASPTAGVPSDWAATSEKAGVNLLGGLDRNRVRRIAAAVHAMKRPGDIAIASLHWGGNWGYRIESDEIAFAHQLVDEAGIDIVHG
ncbi:MAG: CapA family protein, partial [Gammaproteobacteria bacterium]